MQLKPILTIILSLATFVANRQASCEVFYRIAAPSNYGPRGSTLIEVDASAATSRIVARNSHFLERYASYGSSVLLNGSVFVSLDNELYQASEDGGKLERVEYHVFDKDSQLLPYRDKLVFWTKQTFQTYNPSTNTTEYQLKNSEHISQLSINSSELYYLKYVSGRYLYYKVDFDSGEELEVGRNPDEVKYSSGSKYTVDLVAESESTLLYFRRTISETDNTVSISYHRIYFDDDIVNSEQLEGPQFLSPMDRFVNSRLLFFEEYAFYIVENQIFKLKIQDDSIVLVHTYQYDELIKSVYQSSPEEFTIVEIPFSTREEDGSIISVFPFSKRNLSMEEVERINYRVDTSNFDGIEPVGVGHPFLPFNRVNSPSLSTDKRYVYFPFQSINFVSTRNFTGYIQVLGIDRLTGDRSIQSLKLRSPGEKSIFGWGPSVGFSDSSRRPPQPEEYLYHLNGIMPFDFRTHQQDRNLDQTIDGSDAILRKMEIEDYVEEFDESY